MAATSLNRTTLVRLPPRAVGERAVSEQAVLSVLETSGPGARWSTTSLDAMPATRRVALVLDARDVTLLALSLPPLPARKLAQALPNIVEDVLLQDPQACAMAIGPETEDGRRLVAVTDRSWLAQVVEIFEQRGMRVVAIWPGQLMLALRPERWSVDVIAGALVVRTGAIGGFGWTLGDTDADAEAAIAAAMEAALAESAKPQGIDAPESDAPWRVSLGRAAAGQGLNVTSAEAGEPTPAPVDLLEGLGQRAAGRWAARVDWRAWRVPAWTLAACVVVALTGLNLDWALKAREHANLRARLESTFRVAFPDAQVVIDPVLQMQRRVSDLRQGAGRSGPSDFLPLLGRLADTLGDEGADALIGLEYREGRLRARTQAGAFDGPARREALRLAGRQRGLSIEFESAAGATVLVVKAQP
jgi:general secretion pathway protein L